MKKNNNSITTEDLAAMVKRGFDQTATKDDLKKLATKVELHDVKGIVRDTVEELNAMHVDVRYIRSTTDRSCIAISRKRMPLKT